MIREWTPSDLRSRCTRLDTESVQRVLFLNETFLSPLPIFDNGDDLFFRVCVLCVADLISFGIDLSTPPTPNGW
jgi:hypothetical protein